MIFKLFLCLLMWRSFGLKCIGLTAKELNLPFALLQVVFLPGQRESRWIPARRAALQDPSCQRPSADRWEDGGCLYHWLYQQPDHLTDLHVLLQASTSARRWCPVSLGSPKELTMWQSCLTVAASLPVAAPVVLGLNGVLMWWLSVSSGFTMWALLYFYLYLLDW